MNPSLWYVGLASSLFVFITMFILQRFVVKSAKGFKLWRFKASKEKESRIAELILDFGVIMIVSWLFLVVTNNVLQLLKVEKYLSEVA